MSFMSADILHPGMKQPVPVALDEDTVVPMGTRVLFQCRQMPELKIGAEICEDVWAPNPPGVEHALAGATTAGQSFCQ